MGWDSPIGKSSGGVYLSESSFGHTGFTGTSIWIDPVIDLYIILLTNRTYEMTDRYLIKKFRPQIHDYIIKSVIN